MSNSFWYSVFRPVDNRNYIGLKKYRILYLIRLLPLFILVLVVLFSKPSKTWLTITGFIALIIVINYLVLAVQEKALWKLIFKKYYANQQEPVDYEMMKAYEKNPTPENFDKIKGSEKNNGSTV